MIIVILNELNKNYWTWFMRIKTFNQSKGIDSVAWNIDDAAVTVIGRVDCITAID